MIQQRPRDFPECLEEGNGLVEVVEQAGAQDRIEGAVAARVARDFSLNAAWVIPAPA